MGENEYLIEVMTKIDSFNQWLDKYNNFDFSNIHTFDLILCGLIAPFLIPLLSTIFKPGKSSSKKSRVEFTLSVILITFLSSLILFVSAFLNHLSHEREIRDSKNANITLEEFQKYKPIDFDKFPEWARNELIIKGKLYYISVRQAIDEQEDEKNRIKNLERIEKRKELMNSMSK